MTKEELEKLKQKRIEKAKTLANSVQALIDAKQKVVDMLKAKKDAAKVSNTIDDEASAKIDAAIAEREEEIKYLSEIKQEAINAPDDKSDELMAKLAELQEKFKGMEEKAKAAEEAASLKVKNYLNSKQALKDFNDIVQNSRNSAQFRENWHNVLVKNNITPKDVMLPGLVVQAINDGWSNETGRFMQMLNWLGLKHFKSLIEKGTGTDSEAHFHTKGTDKSEQELDFYEIELRPSYIYKYIEIDKETEREDENGILIKYITQELVNRIGALAANQVVKGTNTTTNLFGCSHGSWTWRTYEVTDTTEALIYSCGVAADMVLSGGRKVLIVSAENYTKLRTVKWNIDNATGGGENVLLNREQTCARVGVDDLIVLNDFDTFANCPADKDCLALIMDVNAYGVVGDKNVEEYRDFKLQQNMNQYLAEMYIGGGLMKMHSACYVIKAKP